MKTQYSITISQEAVVVCHSRRWYMDNNRKIGFDKASCSSFLTFRRERLSNSCWCPGFFACVASVLPLDAHSTVAVAGSWDEPGAGRHQEAMEPMMSGFTTDNRNKRIIHPKTDGTGCRI
jgi:hypothetical protein